MSRTAITNEPYFVTLTVTDWIDVFTRRYYSDFIVENLNFCQKEKGLSIYSYVIMTNHIHMITNAENGSLSDILRDFKTFTSKRLIKMIAENQQESKREWIIKAFENAGKHNPQNVNHQFWQNGNFPTLIYSREIFRQKEDYIHNNPVRAGLVDEPWKYHYSSANPQTPLKIII